MNQSSQKMKEDICLGNNMNYNNSERFSRQAICSSMNNTLRPTIYDIKNNKKKDNSTYKY